MERFVLIILCCVLSCANGIAKGNYVAKKLAKEVVEEQVERQVTKQSAKAIAKTITKKTVNQEIKTALKIGLKQIDDPVLRQVTKNIARKKLQTLAAKEGCKTLQEFSKKKCKEEINRLGRKGLKGMVSLRKGKYVARTKAVKNQFLGCQKTLSALAKGPKAHRELKSFISRQNVSSNVLYGTKRLTKTLPRTAIQSELTQIQKKGAISLTSKEMSYLQENPEQIRHIIQIKTGDNKNFQEFFIRLSMADNNHSQVKSLLNNSKIRQYVDKSIRQGGGVHEWLMTSKYKDFLTNKKWGNDGPFLALSLNKLVQKTDNVIFKAGGGHVSSVYASSSKSIAFHNGLSKVIDNCSSKEEVFVKVKKYARSNLDKNSYREFLQIFNDVFYTSAH